MLLLDHLIQLGRLLGQTSEANTLREAERALDGDEFYTPANDFRGYCVGQLPVIGPLRAITAVVNESPQQWAALRQDARFDHYFGYLSRFVLVLSALDMYADQAGLAIRKVIFDPADNHLLSKRVNLAVLRTDRELLKRIEEMFVFGPRIVECLSSVRSKLLYHPALTNLAGKQRRLALDPILRRELQQIQLNARQEISTSGLPPLMAGYAFDFVKDLVASHYQKGSSRVRELRDSVENAQKLMDDIKSVVAHGVGFVDPFTVNFDDVLKFDEYVLDGTVRTHLLMHADFKWNPQLVLQLSGSPEMLEPAYTIKSLNLSVRPRTNLALQSVELSGLGYINAEA